MYNLVIYHPIERTAEVLLVEVGHDLTGLNVVFCDPNPIHEARDGSQWHIDLCRRILSRTGGHAGFFM